MIEHLSTLVENFPGAANQTRCFAHILNLVAKSILRQFEVRKKAGNDPEDADEAKKALAALSQELEVEENTDISDELEEEEEVDSEGEDEVDNDDDDDGLGDEREGMSEEEVAELEETVVPIRLMLTKVSLSNMSVTILSLIIVFINPASCTCKCNQELVHHNTPSMARKARGS
jgi:hypothetical protein